MKNLRREAHRFLAGGRSWQASIFACAATAVFCIAFVSMQVSTNAQQPAKSGPYTTEQATAGRATYQVKCSTCHLPDMKGSNEAPPLTGVNFANAWRDRAASDLLNRIRTTMPLTDPGSLSDEEAVDIVAFIFQANGASPGARPLTPATTATIGSIIGSGAAAMPPQSSAPAPAGQNSLVRPTRPSGAPPGLTVTGEVRNYVPVTDEMLLHADPSDWLMVRGNYQAWNHSALAQITRDNVKDLKLAWVWAMNDGVGANEPTPLVHNGIIYLTNVDNILQAIDGRTGDLIWENRLRPQGSQGGGTGAMRNLAIYQDKVFAATTDAHLSPSTRAPEKLYGTP